jgi:hypothetical protein
LLPQYGIAGRTEKKSVARLGISCGMKQPSIIFKSAAKAADQNGGAAPKPPVWGEQQTNRTAIVIFKKHPIPPFFSDFFLLNLTHATAF